MNRIFTLLLCSLLILTDTGCQQISYSSNIINLEEYANAIVSSSPETIVVDEEGNDITSVFISRFGKTKNQNQILQYLADNKYSFQNTHESNDLNVTRIFSTKRITQISVDSFTVDYLDNTPVTELFISSISVSVIYNIHTYEILDIFPNSITSMPEDITPRNSNIRFKTNGYFIQHELSKDGTYVNNYATIGAYATLHPTDSSKSTEYFIDTIWRKIRIEP